nr:glycosyltransferase [Halofilum ochraceum]
MLSICLISYNRCERLRKTLLGLLSEFSGICDIYVLNNGSTDGTRAMLEAEFQGIEGLYVTHANDNMGVARGRERLWRVARGSFILSLDDDIEISRQVLDNMQTCAELNSSCGVVSPDILDSETGKCINRNPEKWGVQLPTFYEACFLIKKDVITAVGYFDRNLRVAGEGMDYALRMDACGFEVCRVFGVEVVHFDRERSADEQLSRRIDWGWCFAYLFFKNLNAYKAFFYTGRNCLAHIRAVFRRRIKWKWALQIALVSARGAVSGYRVRRKNRRKPASKFSSTL